MKACPDCSNSDGLWLGFTVEGWKAVDSDMKPTHERDVDWTSAIADGQAGCRCGWEGFADELETLGIDGKPPPVIHRAQLSIQDRQRTDRPDDEPVLASQLDPLVSVARGKAKR